MEEMNTMGVNTEVTDVTAGEGVANSQMNETQQLPEVTNQIQQQQTQSNEGFEKAFAARLAHEKEKIESQYRPYVGVLEKAASQYNMTVDQYLQALEQQEQQNEKQKYIDQGINPDLINQIIEKNPIYQQAQNIVQEREQEQQFNTEANELFKAFPDLKAEDVPQEVFDLKTKTGMPLLYAYKSYMFDNVKQSTEQETIRKLQNNASSSPGALGEEGSQHNTSIKSMSAKDFNSLVEKVKRGEIQNL